MAKQNSLTFAVYLFDVKCNALNVNGISIQLFDSANNSRLDKKVSAQIGTASEWGGKLAWNQNPARQWKLCLRIPNISTPGRQFLTSMVTSADGLTSCCTIFPRGAAAETSGAGDGNARGDFEMGRTRDEVD